MDMQQYAGSESKYLKAADLNGKRVKAVIEDVVMVEFKDDDGRAYEKPALRLEGKEKMVVCNPTTVQELGYAYGFDSDDWKGKSIGIATKHYQSLGKDGLVVTALDKPRFEEDDIPF